MMFYELYNRLQFAASLLVAVFIVCGRLPKCEYFLARAVAACATTTALSLIPFEKIIPSWEGALIVKHLVMFLMSTGVIAVCRKCNIYVVLLVGVVGYCTQHIAAHLYIVLFDLFGNNSRFASVFMFIVCCLLSYLAVYFFFVRKLEKDSVPIINNRAQLVLSVIVFTITICLTILGVSYSFMYDSFSLLAIVCVLSIFACVLGVWVEKLMISVKQSERDMEIVNLLLKKQSQQYAGAKESVNLINIKCHDLRHGFNLRSFDGEDESEVENAINVYDSTFETGNEALDVVLTEKSLQCASKKIRLTCLLDGSELNAVKPSDIYSLFGNALDNAIESAENLDEDRKTISITQVKNGNVLKIIIENYYDGKIRMENGMPVTPKDTAFHGYGMKSMRAIVQKYGGELSVSAKGGIFGLNILLFVK